MWRGEATEVGEVSAETSPHRAGVWGLQDSSQIELLKELLDLQKDMVVMLLSLLEGKHLGVRVRGQ